MATFQINAGHVSRFRAINAGQILTVAPGQGGQAYVEYCLGTMSDAMNVPTSWQPWPSGYVSSSASDMIEKNGFIRVTAIGANVSYTINEHPSAADKAPFLADWMSLEYAKRPYANVPAFGSINKRSGHVALPATASTAAGGWSVDAGCTLSLVPSSISPSGFATRVQAPTNGATTVTLRRKITKTAPVSFSGKVSVPVKPGPNVGNMTMNCVLSNDIPAADPPTSTPANRASYLWQPSQWRNGFDQIMSVNLTAPVGRVPDLATNFPADPTVAFPAGQAISVTGSPDLYNYHQAQLVFFLPGAPTAADNYVDFGDIFFDENSTPCISFVWDGGGEYPSHRQYVRPMFDEFGFSCTFSPQGQVIDSAIDELMALYGAGHDVSNEGYNHVNYQSNPNLLLPDFLSVRDKLNGYGMTRASNIATMPFNAILTGLTTSGNGAQQLFGNGFVAVRATNRWTIPTPKSGRGAPLFGGYGIDKCSAAEMLAYVDSLILLGESGRFIGHDVTSENVPGSLQVTTAALYSLLQTLANYQSQGLIRVVSESQMWKGIYP